MKAFSAIRQRLRLRQLYTDTSFLGWPAWLRVASTLPVLLALWWAVGWAAAQGAGL